MGPTPNRLCAITRSHPAWVKPLRWAACTTSTPRCCCSASITATTHALHLAEYRATWPSKHTYTEGVPIMVDGSRRWVTYEDLELDDSDFGDIGAAFADAGHEHTGPAGAGVARLCAVRTAVDFAVDWIRPIANERTAPKPLRSTAKPRTVLSCTSGAKPLLAGAMQCRVHTATTHPMEQIAAEHDRAPGGNHVDSNPAVPECCSRSMQRMLARCCSGRPERCRRARNDSDARSVGVLRIVRECRTSRIANER